jgi:hypothetical protein
MIPLIRLSECFNYLMVSLLLVVAMVSGVLVVRQVLVVCLPLAVFLLALYR